MRSISIVSILAVLLLPACMNKTGTNNFDKEQVNLIMAGDSLSPMRVLRTTNMEDSLFLRRISENVVPDPDDEVLQRLVDRMLATVTDMRTLGVGIAAPQVGILKNVILVQRFDDPSFPFGVYLNPVIKQYSRQKQPYTEGCLSIPNVRGRTENRAYIILLEYQDMQGETHTEMVEGMTAVIFQHEVDHLNGILFTDHLETKKEDIEL
jgi:peptide deformylase